MLNFSRAAAYTETAEMDRSRTVFTDLVPQNLSFGRCLKINCTELARVFVDIDLLVCYADLL